MVSSWYPLHWSPSRCRPWRIGCPSRGWKRTDDVPFGSESWGRTTFPDPKVVIPSGNSKVCYGKLPFIVGLPIKKGDFPRLCKRLQEGKQKVMNHETLNMVTLCSTDLTLSVMTYGNSPSKQRVDHETHLEATLTPGLGNRHRDYVTMFWVVPD